MKGEGSDDFDPKDLDEKIGEKRKIVQKKEGSQNPIQKNPKASLAIASIVFAALVIGMIATFGGVGMINGVLLGKVVLTAVTAGTAAFGAKKLYDTVKGDKDKHQLRELEKTRDSLNRRKTEEIARAAKLELANLKEQARDRGKVDMVMGRGWKQDENEGNKFKGPGNIYGERIVELTDAQKRLHDAKKEASESANELLKTQTQTLNSSIASLSTKLGMPDADLNKTEDLKKLLDADVKKSDGSPLDNSGSTNKDLLKEILQAGLGINSNGSGKISQGSSDFIDPLGRINILRELNKALEFDGNFGPKFKSDTAKTDEVKLDDLKKLVKKEKTRTKEAKEKSANRGVA